MKVTEKELKASIEAKDWKAVEKADVSEITNMWSMFKGSKRKIGNIDDWIISEGMLKDSCHPNPNYNSDGVRLWKLANL